MNRYKISGHFLMYGVTSYTAEEINSSVLSQVAQSDKLRIRLNDSKLAFITPDGAVFPYANPIKLFSEAAVTVDMEEPPTGFESHFILNN